MASSISFFSGQPPISGLSQLSAGAQSIVPAGPSDSFCAAEPSGLMRRSDFLKACQNDPPETLGPLHGFTRLASAAEEAQSKWKAPGFLGPVSALTQLNSENPGDVIGGALDLAESGGKWLAKNGPQVLRRGVGEAVEHLTPLGHAASVVGLNHDLKESGQAQELLAQYPTFNARVQAELGEQRMRSAGLAAAAGFESLAIVPGVGVVFAGLGAVTEVGTKLFTDSKEELEEKQLIPKDGTFYG